LSQDILKKNAIERMVETLNSLEPYGDKKAIFLNCYLLMTEQMYQAVNQGRFKDGTWVMILLERFADYYFDALDQYNHKEKFTPKVWHFVHDSSDHSRMHVLQHLFLGINAHINYDLVLTLHDVISDEWCSMDESMKALRFHDHCIVNDIIAETIDEVQDKVVERYAPSMDIIDKGMGRLDEKIFEWLIRRWRGEVWKDFLKYIQCNEEKNRTLFRHSLERKVMRRARIITLRA
jgi:hypothetical protein